MISPHSIKKYSEKHAGNNMKFRAFLKNKAKPKELDQQFRDLHNEIFIKDEYNCCKCANCCKVYDIRIESKDIPAIASYLGQSESDFIKMYLVQDEQEPDAFIMRDKPCSFLEADGKCKIYEVRPLVCKEFPHTNKPDRLFSMTGIMEFAEDCPVVFEIIEKLKQHYNFK